MKKPVKREVIFAFADGFQTSFDAFVQPETKRAERFKTFMENKGDIPPRRLPGTMNDHSLTGSLSDFRECHLDGDVLLLYTHENDTVMLYRVCNHSDIKGKHGSRLAKLLGK